MAPSAQDSIANQNSTVPVPAPQGRIRLGFLDGIRGWAALYVVLHHLGTENSVKAKYPLLFSWMHNGHYAVSIFIVLSGYCLMLPVARSGKGILPGGFATYIRRRARRMLPPYYAAFGFSLLVILASMAYHSANGQSIEDEIAQFGIGNLATHALVVHNLSKEYAEYTNPPLWSVGTEWHIYFLFPALLLPIWRRFGTPAAIIGGIVIGAAPVLLLPKDYNLSWACPWYLGVFAIGMGAAAVGFKPDIRMQSLSSWRGWRWVCAVSSIIAYLIISRFTQTFGFPIPIGITDIIVGIATASGIMVLTDASRRNERGFVSNFLESPVSETLGRFSYSLYLVHMPIWFLLTPISAKLAGHPWLAQLFRLGVAVPLAVAGGWVFYLLVERHFVNAPVAAPAAPQLTKNATPSQTPTAVK